MRYKKYWWEYLFFNPIRYVEGGGGGGTDGPPPLPEGFTPDSLQGEAWAGIIGGNDSWKGNEVLRNTKGLSDLIDQFTNANKLIGQNRLPSPRDDWKEEDWNNFYAALGRPEAADKYDLGKIAEGVELDPEFMSKANEALHKLGLNQKQYSGVMGTFFEWLKGAMTTSVETNTASRMEAELALKKELGNTYEPKVNRANALLSTVFDEGVMKEIASTGLGNNPAFIKGVIALSEQFGDDSALGEGMSKIMTGENSAKLEIENLKQDTDFQKKLMDASHPDHKNAVAKWHKLHEVAFPSKK